MVAARYFVIDICFFVVFSPAQDQLGSIDMDRLDTILPIHRRYEVVESYFIWRVIWDYLFCIKHVLGSRCYNTGIAFCDKTCLRRTGDTAIYSFMCDRRNFSGFVCVHILDDKEVDKI